MADSKEKQCADKAVELFAQNYNCAESLLLATCQTCGVEENSLVPRIASGFGAGFGRLGYACGALTGSMLGLGALYGRDTSGGDRDRIYSRVVKLEQEFREKFGTINCREIIGFDMTVPEEMKAAKESGVFETKCAECVRAAAEITGRICSEE